jgi:pyruvate/2-oxoglutarate dehydrogenase complex dihydrolipoamide acyltransferase (E2) component
MSVWRVMCALSVVAIAGLFGCQSKPQAKAPAQAKPAAKTVTAPASTAKPAAAPAAAAPAPTAEPATTETVQPAETIVQRVAEQKRDLGRSIGARLQTLRQEVADLEVKAKAKGGQAVADAARIKAEMQGRTQTVKRELDKALANASHLWPQLKARVEGTMTGVEKDFKENAARILGPSGAQQ